MVALARWQSTIQDDAGNIQKIASVEVRHERPGAPLANIYSDRDGTVPLGNPFLADDEGFAAFHALGGAYRITATKNGFSKTWRYVGIGNAQEQDGIASGVRLRFNEDTDSSDPGNGFLKFNNTDLGSVTEFYISSVNFLGFDISSFVESFDGGGIISNRGLLTIQTTNNDGFFIGQITGSVVSDGSPSSFYTLSVTPLAYSNGLFKQDDLIGIVFNQAGGGLAAPVSFADIQQISSQRILGRLAAGAGNIEQLTISALREFLVEPGTVKPWLTSTPPTGWAEMNGSERPRTDNLFALIGVQFGDGDGSTTYNLPDWRGKFVRGWDHGAGNDPNAASRTDRGDGTGGDNVGTEQADAFQGHWHNFRSTQQVSGGGGGPSGYNGSLLNITDSITVTNPISDGPNGTPRTSSETRPRNVAAMWIIKT
jgi:hypothetical protein